MSETFRTSGLTAAIATMHGKEGVIAPILTQTLGLVPSLTVGLDTDKFGTFSREIERRAGQLETARAKALAALLLDINAHFAVASEGSFGPDPFSPFMGVGREIVLMIDRQTGAEVAGFDITPDTNYGHRVVRDIEDGLSFSRHVGIPEHSVVVMTAKGDQPDTSKPVLKGLSSPDEIRSALEEVLRCDDQAFIEADMRAHCNPTRMKSIERAAFDMIRRWQSKCPTCGYPGWNVARRLPGRKCHWCGNPTRLPATDIYRCNHCSYETYDDTPGKGRAAPGACDICNP